MVCAVCAVCMCTSVCVYKSMCLLVCVSGGGGGMV